MTVKKHTPEDLAITSSIWSETKGRKETDDYVWLDLVAVPKSEKYRTWQPRMPSYRRGWGYPLPKSARFGLVPFIADRNGERIPAIAVILREPDEEIFVAWFREEREAEARSTVDELNAEIEEIWRIWEGTQQTSTPAAAPSKWLRYECGHEFAPEARTGAQTLTLRDDGEYSYTRRRNGRLLASRSGVIARERVAEIFAMLRRSTFPVVPEHMIPPGASLVRLSVGEGSMTGEPLTTVDMHVHFARKLPCYGEVIDWLRDLMDAIDNDDTATLDTWRSSP